MQMLHSVQEILKVDLSKTIGQESAIEANGSPIFVVIVTEPAFSVGEETIAGFGRVVSEGAVKGHEVLYSLESVIA